MTAYASKNGMALISAGHVMNCLFLTIRCIVTSAVLCSRVSTIKDLRNIAHLAGGHTVINPAQAHRDAVVAYLELSLF